MILLSKSSKVIGRKEIKLRPIVPLNINKGVNKDVEQHEVLIEQIGQAKRQLDKLKNEIEVRTHQVEQEINEKRIEWAIEKEALIETTKHDAEKLGYDEGKVEGLKVAQEKVILADQIIEKAKDERLKVIGQSESVILELATKIATKIITYEIEENKAFLAIVSQAIEEVEQKGQVQIYTSEDDYAFIQEQRDQLLTLIPPDVILSIHPKRSMSSGDCIIQTPDAKIDASVDRQLQKVKKRLVEVMEEMRREHQ